MRIPHKNYLIVEDSPGRLSRPVEIAAGVLMLLLALAYCVGFAYYATEPDPFLDHRQIERK